jgi:ribosomal protein L2
MKSLIPLHFLKMKKFFISTTYSQCGRSKKTGILCRTKGRVLHKHRYPLINSKFRTLSLSFIGGYYSLPLKLKTLSFVISASGDTCYIPTTSNHTLFQVSKLVNAFFQNKKISQYLYLSDFIKIPQICHLVWQLPKFKLISFLEVFPGRGAQYVKSPGSKSYIIKTNTKTNLALIKLPSGVHKTFSVYSVGFLGRIPLIDKNIKTQANAGFFKKLGKKSLSRGVAKNPVDHPHGGRNKAIKYQRTPWGKTTKFK